MKIDAMDLNYQELNRKINRAQEAKIIIEHCNGQRYIANGQKEKDITIYGTPGNALGAYLCGGRITVYGNVQEATGDTMDNGTICIHGNAGDGTGYAMRGGKIFVRGNIGYRAGIHMKAYRDKSPVLVVGGSAGSFLGEYQAGGSIIVLGLDGDGRPPVGYFCGTGMHGGKIYLRCRELPSLPPQIIAQEATKQDLYEIIPVLEEFCKEFGLDYESLRRDHFFVLCPNSKSPYRQMYTPN